MKNRASFVLMEQLVMILVVALAAVVCLRAFLWSDQTSRKLAQRDEAVVLCQNAAETLKSCADVAAAAEILGAAWEEDAWVIHAGEIDLEIAETEPLIPGLEQASVCAVDAQSGELLFSLTVGWQEVGE